MSEHGYGPAGDSADNGQLSDSAIADVDQVDDVDGDQVDDDDSDAPKITGKVIGVTLLDGRQFSVTVRNRDYLAWDMTAPRRKWNAQQQPFVFGNFLAWSAAKRDGLFDGTFDGREPGSWWNSVDDIDQSAQAAAIPPTRPAVAPR